jgi:ElaB/YqjD/DUF883 family membrane-anchored ribosome-binding protein
MSKLTETIKSAAENAKGGISSAKSKASETTSVARKKAVDVYGLSKDAATRGVQSSKELANRAVMKSGDTLDSNPIAMVVGGIALGAILGALLPKSEREEQILGKAGKKLNGKMRDVALAAKEAGKDKIDSFGINKDFARDQFRDLVSKATEAVKAAGQAASDVASKRD